MNKKQDEKSSSKGWHFIFNLFISMTSVETLPLTSTSFCGLAVRAPKVIVLEVLGLKFQKDIFM